MRHCAVLGVLLSCVLLCSQTDALSLFGPAITDPYRIRITNLIVSAQQLQWSREFVNLTSSAAYYNATPANYALYLEGPGYSGGFTFQGAACLNFSLRIADANKTGMGIILVEDDTWEYANLLTTVDVEFYATPGLVPGSACEQACSGQLLGLDPAKPYQQLLVNEGTNTMHSSLDWTTYDAAAPECAGTSAPTNVSEAPVHVPDFPPALVEDSQVLINYQTVTGVGQASSQTANLTVSPMYIVQNASCVFLSMWLPDVLPQDAPKYSVALYTADQFASAVWDFDVTQPYNLTYCSGDTCNATAGVWIKQYGLSPGHDYWVVSSYDWSLEAVNSLQRNYAYVQPFTSEECAVLQQQDAAAAASPPAPPTGGVVGGIAGAGMIIAFAVFALLRRKHGQQSDLASNMDPLRKGSGESTSERSSAATLSSFKLGPGFDSKSGTISPAAPAGSNDQAWAVLNNGKALSSLSSGSSIGAQWTIDPACIRICQHEDGSLVKLGSGGFGSVYKAVHDDVRVVAVKVLQSGGSPQNSLRDAAIFWTEIERLSEIRDKSVVQFYGAVAGENVMLVTECCERGDLYNALANMRPHCDGILCWYRKGQNIALDIARGLHALHSRNLIHFDVKSPNILLTRNFEAKVADVGLSHPLLSKTHLSNMSNRGTWAWQAPELILGRAASTSADVWSYGVVLYEIITGDRPQRGRLRQIRVPEECPLEVEELMDACLEEEPSARPTIKEVINRLQTIVQQQD